MNEWQIERKLKVFAVDKIRPHTIAKIAPVYKLSTNIAQFTHHTNTTRSHFFRTPSFIMLSKIFLMSEDFRGVISIVQSKNNETPVHPSKVSTSRRKQIYIEHKCYYPKMS
jgi:hypothetical protein